MARKSKGRQKVNMVKMQNESNLQVTFSKRRSGLFKKASELCTLCGAEVAIIVFSPGQKVYSFGHPCVDTIVNRYLNRNPPIDRNNNTNNDRTGNQIMEAHRNASVRELNMDLTHVESLLEAERKRGEHLDQIRKASRNHHWWDAPMEELNLQQLEQLKTGMENLKSDVDKEVHKLMFQAANSLPMGMVPFEARAPMGIVPFEHNRPPPSFIHGGPMPPPFMAAEASSTSGAVNIPFAAATTRPGGGAANSAMQIGPSGTKSHHGLINPEGYGGRGGGFF